MVVIVASFKAQPGKEMALEELLKSLIPNVQREEGTLMYTLHRAKKNPGKILLYEMYKDKEALAFHSSTPYFEEFRKQLGEFLDGKSQIDVYEDIASISR